MEPLATAYRDPPPFSHRGADYELTVLAAGGDRLARMLELIESAKTSIRMCFYIFAADATGRAVVERLLAARLRGVEVALLTDGFGSSSSPDAMFAPLREAGCRYCRFSPRWGARYLVRNHQKLVVIDDAIALTGGFNIEDDYFAPPDRNGWNDIGVEITGPIVAALARWFDAIEAWSREPSGAWRKIRRMVRDWKPGNGKVRLLIGGPTRGLSQWARAVRFDLATATRLDMVMAYFSPAARLLARIGSIARGGEVRLLLPAKSDNGATIGASRLLYGPLLKRGAKIWEFLPCKLHTKLIVIDDVVYIGSANFDMRSLYINLELMLRIDDAVLAERMRAFVSQHLPASLPITRELHRERLTLVNRIRWTASWFLVSVVDYTVSRRLNLGL